MSESFIIPDETIINKIYLFRNKKVMIDADLAELYGVETRVLNQAIKRNLIRFPEDFMFQLTEEEFKILKSQIATSSWGGRRKLPFVFTEHGVLMLSSILNSDRAIKMNIQIVRIFTKMREMLLTHNDILTQLKEMKKSIEGQDDRIDLIYNYLMEFVKKENLPKKTIGYKSK
ncbi:MAG: ORF6N domain-containing protein [Bacteroidota bacterium]